MSLCWPPHDPSYAPRSAHPSVYNTHNPPNVSHDTPSSFAFVYGQNGLNPSLQPHNASTRRRRKNPPWVSRAGKSRWSDDEADSEEDEEPGFLGERVFEDEVEEAAEEEVDSDDEPLGLRARMVRRGSEGLEVRGGMTIHRSWEEMERERVVEEYERRRGLR
jgi:hypothetical protein